MNPPLFGCFALSSRVWNVFFGQNDHWYGLEGLGRVEHSEKIFRKEKISKFIKTSHLGPKMLKSKVRIMFLLRLYLTRT